MFRRERVKLKEGDKEKGREKNRGRGRVKWRSSEKMRERVTKVVLEKIHHTRVAI